AAGELVRPDQVEALRTGAIGVRERALELRIGERELDRLAPGAQRRAQSDRGGPLRLPEREDVGGERARELGPQSLVGPQLAAPGGADAEARRRQRRTAERFEQAVVAAAAADRAQLPLGVERLEDDARVVGEAAHDGGVEDDPVAHAVGLEQAEELLELA